MNHKIARYSCLFRSIDKTHHIKLIDHHKLTLRILLYRLSGPRDKPKRYSTQRQKTGTSMLDIPSQIPENEEARQYLEQLGKFR